MLVSAQMSMASLNELRAQFSWRGLFGRIAAIRPLDPWLLLLISCAALGCVLRLRNVSSIPLWLDEAGWARLLITEPLLKPSIRPLGFMALSALAVRQLGPTELGLRLLPCVCGLATAALSVPLARLLFRGRAAQFLLVAGIALHPLAIDYSKEFKPYAVSLYLHLLCLLLVLQYRKTRDYRFLLGAVSSALIGVLFAQELVFAFPGLFLVLGLTAYRDRQYRHLTTVAAGAVLTLLLVLSFYFIWWRWVNSGAQAVGDYWGNKYGVFYTAQTSDSRLAWIWEKYQEIAVFPGDRRIRFAAMDPPAEWVARIDSGVWLILHLLGLATLVIRRRFTELLLLALPLLLCLGFNQLGYWPFGAFRTNLFILAYVCPIAASALEPRSDAEPANWSAWGACALVLAPLLLFERDWHKNKLFSSSMSSFPALVESLVEQQGKDYDGDGEALVLDAYSCSVWSYYLGRHPAYAAQAKEVERRFWRRCARFGQRAFIVAQRHSRRWPGRVWVVLTNPQEMEEIRSGRRGTKGIEVHELADGSAMIVSMTSPRRRR